jgi:hypothetical protein
MPIQGSGRRYNQCCLGDHCLEHEKDCSSAQGKGRKAATEADEAGRIGNKSQENNSTNSLSSIVKEQIY